MSREYFAEFGGESFLVNDWHWPGVERMTMGGRQIWPPVADGAWMQDSPIPLGWDERDALI